MPETETQALAAQSVIATPRSQHLMSDEAPGTQPSGTQPGGKYVRRKLKAKFKTTADYSKARPIAHKQPSGTQLSGTQPGVTQPSGTQPSGTQLSGTLPSGTLPSGTQLSGTQPPMEDEENDNPGVPDDVIMPFSRLTLCSPDMRDVVRECISQEVRARLIEFDVFKKELKGYMYLVPTQSPAMPIYAHWEKITTPNKTDVNLNMTIRYDIGKPSFIETWFRMSFKKHKGQWKLYDTVSELRGRDPLQITVKRTGSDDWTPVVLHYKLGYTTFYLLASTTFYHGDQVNVRIVNSSGQSDPVSFDGTEESNYFPITVRII